VALIALAAWFGGRQGLFENFWSKAGALVLLSPVLVVAAYSFLRDDELEPYRGRELWLRAVICGGVYAVLWGIFGHVLDRMQPNALYSWGIIVPPFVAVGATAAAFSLDLDFGNAAFHYSFYLLVTTVLRWAAGLGWVWNIVK
jgi:hypothetical protein